MNPRVVICHHSEQLAGQLASALTASRIVQSAEVSVGLDGAHSLAQQPGRLDACLIDSALLVKCLEKGRLPRAPRGHEMRRIVLSAGIPNSLWVQAALAGVEDVVDITQPADSLLGCLRDSLAGRHSLGDCALWRTMKAPREVNTINSPYHDNIDREIVSMISSGMTDDEIARGVYLSCQTVRNRISRMLERSGARNRTELATMFVREQYRELDGKLSQWPGRDNVLSGLPTAV